MSRCSGYGIVRPERAAFTRAQSVTTSWRGVGRGAANMRRIFADLRGNTANYRLYQPMLSCPAREGRGICHERLPPMSEQPPATKRVAPRRRNVGRVLGNIAVAIVILAVMAGGFAPSFTPPPGNAPGA